MYVCLHSTHKYTNPSIKWCFLNEFLLDCTLYLIATPARWWCSTDHAGRRSAHRWRSTASHVSWHRGHAAGNHARWRGTHHRCSWHSSSHRSHVLLGGSAHTSHGTLETRWHGGQVDRHSASGHATDSRTRSCSRNGNSGQAFLWRRWSLHRQGNYVLAAQQYKAQHALLLALGHLGILRANLPELLAVAEDQVHVFVEGFEGTDEGTRVLQHDSHPIIQVLNHFVVLADRLK